jgi:hypothetical protein
LDKFQKFALICVTLAVCLIIKAAYEYQKTQEAKEIQRGGHSVHPGAFHHSFSGARSLQGVHPLPVQQGAVRSSVEAEGLDRQVSRSDGVGQSKAHGKAVDSKAISEGGVSHQGRSSYLLCAMSHGESAGDDGDKSVQALFPEDVEDVEAAWIARCRSYRIADNDK